MWVVGSVAYAPESGLWCSVSLLKANYASVLCLESICSGFSEGTAVATSTRWGALDLWWLLKSPPQDMAGSTWQQGVREVKGLLSHAVIETWLMKAWNSGNNPCKLKLWQWKCWAALSCKYISLKMILLFKREENHFLFIKKSNTKTIYFYIK